MNLSKTVSSMLLQNEERQNIKRRYAGHVMYRLCRAVRNVFQAAYPEVTISVEQLFADALDWLDEVFNEAFQNSVVHATPKRRKARR